MAEMPEEVVIKVRYDGLEPAYAELAFRLQEQGLSHSHIRRRLSDALTTHLTQPDETSHVLDVFGGEDSGDVVFSLAGATKRAPYSIATIGGKTAAAIAMDRAISVTPRMVYDEATKLNENAVKIALGLDEDSVREVEQTLDRLFPASRSKETHAKALEIDISGEFIPLKEGAVGQDGTAYLKLIAPGRGSSGYYPEEVLKRDGPKVFPAGTKNFWDHQTEAEESARPEGSLRDLASVLTEDAHYDEKGPAGPGLYAKARVFEQFRKPVDDLAKHIGMSIRAAGKAKEGKAPDGKSGPIIEQLTKGISVDYVTTPGAGGKILQLFEAARSAATTKPEKEVADMDAAEFKKLQEGAEAVAKRLEASEAINRKLAQRLALSEARDFAEKELSGVRLHETAKARVLGRVLGMAPISEAGELDTAKFKTLIADESKDEAAYIGKLTEGRVVTGMGAPPADPPADPAKFEEQFNAEMEGFGKVLGFSEAGAKAFARGRERGAA